MANKIETVMGNIETAMAAMVPATLKAVKRAVIIPAQVHNPPELGIVISRFYREDKMWVAEVGLFLVANKSTADWPDTRIIELVAQVHDAIPTSAQAGASLDLPRWDLWHAAGGHDAGWALVGAVGSMRIRVEDPLGT